MPQNYYATRAFPETYIQQHVTVTEDVIIYSLHDVNRYVLKS
jgi:hypothetical protein